MKTKVLGGWAANVALAPTWLVVIFAYLFTMAWTVQISFTNSKLLPVNDFVGFTQYIRLFGDPRWLIAVSNMVVFGVFFIAGSLTLGFLLAAAIDRQVRAENTFRTIILYPHALSFIITGLIWQWIMNPRLGIQQAVRNAGWEDFLFNWLVTRDRAIYVVVMAGIWQASGLVMAIMLAGLRGVDQDLWRAARVDGIPDWRVYLRIVIPEIRPMIITAVVLLSIGTVKVYDLVVALTQGGPGSATEVPAKYVMEYLFQRANIGLATAAATIMLLTVVAVLAPWLYWEHFRRARKGAA